MHTKSCFNTQEPKKIKLGAQRIFRGHGRKRRLVEVTDTLVYVPLLKTIEMLFKDEGIYTEVHILFFSQRTFTIF